MFGKKKKKNINNHLKDKNLILIPICCKIEYYEKKFNYFLELYILHIIMYIYKAYLIIIKNS